MSLHQEEHQVSLEERLLIQQRLKSKGSVSDDDAEADPYSNDDDEYDKGKEDRVASFGPSSSSSSSLPTAATTASQSPCPAPQAHATASSPTSQTSLQTNATSPTCVTKRLDDVVIQKRTIDPAATTTTIVVSSPTSTTTPPREQQRSSNTNHSSNGSIALRSPLAAVPDLFFPVVKKHHRMTWLKQDRLLIVTPTEIWNCKPLARPGEQPPQVTKSHKIQSISLIAVKSKTSLMLRFFGDHDYFYSSPKVLDILWEVKKRMWAIRAADRLAASELPMTNNGEHQHQQQPDQQRKETLIKNFLTNEIFMPFCDDTTDRALEHKLDIVRAIQVKALDHCERIGMMVDQYNSSNNNSSSSSEGRGDINLEQFREEFEELRDVFACQLVTRQRSLSATLSGKLKRRDVPVFEDHSSASLAVEEALETLIHIPLFDVLWHWVCSSPQIRAQEKEFRAGCKRMCKAGFLVFEIREDFHHMKFDLPLHQLMQVGESKSPLDMMDGIVAVVKSVLVTVDAHALHERKHQQQDEEAADENKLASPAAPRASSLSADEMLPLLIYIIAHSGINGLVFIREFVMQTGDTQDVSERTYYFTMFCSALEYIEHWGEQVQQEEEQQHDGAVARVDGSERREESMEESAASHSALEDDSFFESPEQANFPASFSSESTLQHQQHHLAVQQHLQQHTADTTTTSTTQFLHPRSHQHQHAPDARSTGTSPISFEKEASEEAAASNEVTEEENKVGD